MDRANCCRCGCKPIGDQIGFQPVADKSRDISAVIDLRGGSDRVNAGVTDSASDTDGAILGSSSREAISVADRTDVTAAALTVASAANDGPANARPANDGPSKS